MYIVHYTEGPTKNVFSKNGANLIFTLYTLLVLSGPEEIDMVGSQ